MAINGSLVTTAWKNNTNRTRYLELTWERVSFDVANQTTTIKWTLTSKGNYTGYVTSAPFIITIDGVEAYRSETRIKLYTEKEVATGTHVIKHNADGTKTFSITVKAAIYWSYINVSGSGTFTLDTVGMAKITQAPNFTDEENPTIEYFNPVGSAISSLKAAISLTGADVDIAYRDIDISGGSYTYILTEEERNVLRAATVGSNSRKVFYYLRGVIDGNIYFSYTATTFTVINAQPYIEVGVTDTNAATVALTGDSSTLIRYHSTASASVSAYAYKQATIETTRIENNGEFVTAYSAFYPNVESNVFAFSATDSRNNTVTETIVSPMIDYITPTANLDNTQLMDATGYYNLRCSGNYYNDTFGYTDAAQANTLTVSFRYKESGGSYNEWEVMGHSLEGNTYSAQAFINGLNYRKAYVFQCKVEDKLNTILSAEITVRSLPVFHWSETDFVFEVPVTFNAGTEGVTGGGDTGGSSTSNNIDGDMSITGNLRLKGSGNYGNTLYFGDGSYCYITETTDDDLTIKATDINLNGNVYVNGSAIGGGSGTAATAGTWQPTLSVPAAVSSYSVREGWYQRIGDVVTIGWNVKATIKSGYEGIIINITGVPVNPSVAAFGGGVAHNVTITGGFCFEGWTIDTSGSIAGRGQPCNGTTTGNLQITSGVYYPTGSNNVMTLAGTICYKAA